MGALAIILTAPTFAFAIPFFGKRLIVSQEAAVAPVDTVPTRRETVFETAYLTFRASFLSNLNYGVLGGQQRDTTPKKQPHSLFFLRAKMGHWRKLFNDKSQ